MTTAEGIFPKNGGDPLYYSEANISMYGNKDLMIYEGSATVSFDTTNNISLNTLNMPNGSLMTFRTTNNVDVTLFKNNIAKGIVPTYSGTWGTDPVNLNLGTDNDESTSSDEAITKATGSTTYISIDLGDLYNTQAILAKIPWKPNTPASYTTRNHHIISPGSVRYVRFLTWNNGGSAFLFSQYSPNASSWTDFGSVISTGNAGSTYIKLNEVYVMNSSPNTFNIPDKSYYFTSFDNAGSRALIATQGVTTSGILKVVYNI